MNGSGIILPSTSQRRENLPNLSQQTAWMQGERRWSGQRISGIPAVDYSDGRSWFVVRTLPREEDQALRTLARAGFDAFLPKGKREVVHARTKAKIERTFPLLVGYAFVAMPAAKRLQHWSALRDCHGVHSVLGVNGLPLVLPSREVEILQLADRENRLRFERAERSKDGFQPGVEVRIADGVFTGFAGQIVDTEAKGAICVLITLFNRATHVTVPLDDLEIV